MKSQRRNEREIWKQTELSLVSGVILNGKRDDKGDTERERDMGGGGTREICVLFHYSLWSGDILGGSKKDGRAFLFFLFFSWILFFLLVSPNQLFHFSLPLPHLSFLFLSVLLLYTLRWKFEIFLTLKFMYEIRNNIDCLFTKDGNYL